MLICKGNTYRNIAEKQLPEYVSKGYEVVKTSAPEKPKDDKPTKKKGD